MILLFICQNHVLLIFQLWNNLPLCMKKDTVQRDFCTWLFKHTKFFLNPFLICGLHLLM